MFTRQKKLPDLAKAMRRLDGPVAVVPQTPEALAAKVRILNTLFGGRDLTNG